MVRLCKRGHPRIPENVDSNRRCKKCRRVSNKADVRRYKQTDRGRTSNDRYEAGASAWARSRRYQLKGARERIVDQLEALEREEESFLTSLARQTRTKSREPAPST